MDKQDWEKIGVIGVDAGLCWVGDPCYILHKDKGNDAKNLGKDWHDFCDLLGEHYPTTKQFNYDMGHPGLGVCVSTGYGDGEYSVYAKYENSKGWGKRIKEIKVVFIDDENEE